MSKELATKYMALVKKYPRIKQVALKVSAMTTTEWMNTAIRIAKKHPRKTKK